MIRTGLTIIVALALAACGGGTDKPIADGGTDGGLPPNASPKNQCQRYLACLSAADPGGYAAALELYGDTSACWQSSSTSATCGTACESAFTDVADECACTGTSCTACPNAQIDLTGSDYTVTAAADSCLSIGDSFTFYHGGAAGKTTLAFTATPTQTNDSQTYFSAPISVDDAPLACMGPTTFTWQGNDSSNNCPESATMTLSITSASSLQLSVSVTTTCSGMPASTCAGSFTLTPET